MKVVPVVLVEQVAQEQELELVLAQEQVAQVQELVLVQEALQEEKIAQIAEQVRVRSDVRFVLIAGPSSSGKTTFSHRLSVQLRANGLCPYPIAVDNYFKEREETPKDENGNYDFEGLGAVDVELFNRQLQELLDGVHAQNLGELGPLVNHALEGFLVN